MSAAAAAAAAAYPRDRANVIKEFERIEELARSPGVSVLSILKSHAAPQLRHIKKCSSKCQSSATLIKVEVSTSHEHPMSW
jgi:hypothetical protein